jgi:hypothetical protein
MFYNIVQRSVGNNSSTGSKDKKEIVLDKREFLVRVTHEKYPQVNLILRLFGREALYLSI